MPGGAWVFAVPVEIPALWGAGWEVGWFEGEPIIVVGSDGSGKTVFCWNLTVCWEFESPHRSPRKFAVDLALDGDVVASPI